MEISELRSIRGIESELHALLIEAGQIPGFVVNSSGQPEATVYFYKQL